MRIRTVKPEFWCHPIMARLPERVQLLAIALLNHADDHGYFHADHAIVRGSCAPFRENLATIRDDLAKLSEVGWIEVCSHPSQGDIGVIVNWSRHQKVDHPKASKIAAYFIRENLATRRDNLALDQGSGIREGKGTGSAPELPPGEHLFDQASMDQAKAIMAGDAKTKPALPVAARDFSAFRTLHSKLFIGREERRDWEALHKLYEWDAMHDMHESMTDDPIYLSNATRWLAKNYKLDP